MRAPMVTRTITTTNATVLCVNAVTNEVTDIIVTLPRTYADGEAIMKYLKKTDHDFGDYTPVTVKSFVTVDQLYGMTEADFVAKAEKIDRIKAEDATDAEAAPVVPKKNKKNA